MDALGRADTAVEDIPIDKASDPDSVISELLGERCVVGKGSRTKGDIDILYYVDGLSFFVHFLLHA